jgi:uncharacterized protein YlxW (UPF0749 family)
MLKPFPAASSIALVILLVLGGLFLLHTFKMDEHHNLLAEHVSKLAMRSREDDTKLNAEIKALKDRVAALETTVKQQQSTAQAGQPN